MTVREFLVALEEGSAVLLGDSKAPSPEQVSAAAETLASLDRNARLELAHEAPEFSLAAASWAAVLLYRACQFLVFREVDGDAVREALSIPCPLAPSPSAAYSVDLVFRWLPDVISLARGVADDDPLVAGLLRLSHDWPLSSVGVCGVGAVDVEGFIDDRSLRQLYADRIIERRDAGRLSASAVRAAVHESLGMHADVWPEAARLRSEGPTSE